MAIGTAICELSAAFTPIFPGEWNLESYPLGVDPDDVVMVNSGSTDNLSVTVPSYGEYAFRLTSEDGRTMDYPYIFFPCETVEFMFGGTAVIDGAILNFGDVEIE
jgi:hypothetical protein